LTTTPRIRTGAAEDIENAATYYERAACWTWRGVPPGTPACPRPHHRDARAFPVIENHCRRGLLQRFPYGVYFLLEENAAIVIAVLRMHRHPDTWRTRRSPG
jgi:hypothetical protein